MRLCLTFLAVLGFSAPVALSGDTPAPVQESVFAGEDGAGWRDLVSRLQAQGDVAGAFTERRWFAVRKQPVALTGEMRISGKFGLSLHYSEKGGRTMIVDGRGILLRDERGRTKSVPATAPAAATGVLLLPLLRFDIPELEKIFVITGSRDGEAWRLQFAPRRGELDRVLRDVAITGVGERVERIEIDRGDRQRVEIEVGQTRTGVTFTADEVKKFFRAVP